MTALASVVVFCTTYVLILPAITLTVDEGWMNDLTETHVYINCPGAALYEAASYGGGTVPEDLGSEEGGRVVDVDTEDDVPLTEVPEMPPPGGEAGSAETEPAPETTVSGAEPEQLEKTEEPEEPEQPEKPEEPEGPEQPEKPEEPEGPEQPEKPEEPEEPEQPEESINPETPDNTEQPENPETPEHPEQPSASETPENPDTPETPEIPSSPEQPTDPEPAEPESGITIEDGEIPKADVPEIPEEGYEDLENSEVLEEQESQTHIHSSECCDEDGTLICGEGEEEPEQPQIHVHMEDCFDVNEDGESFLVCQREGHVHNAGDCLDDNGEQICEFEDFFPRDAKLIWVDVDRIFTVALTRYTVTGQVRLPKGMTQDDLFFQLMENQAVFAALDEESTRVEAVPVLFYFTEEDVSEDLLTQYAATLSLTSTEITSGELPHTGGIGLTAWYTAGGALIAAAGLTFAKGKKEDAV